jgi:hypothetical protein
MLSPLSGKLDLEREVQVFEEAWDQPWAWVRE